MRQEYWYLVNYKRNAVFVFPDGQIEFRKKEEAERRRDAFFLAKKGSGVEAEKKLWKPQWGSRHIDRNKPGSLIDDFQRS